MQFTDKWMKSWAGVLSETVASENVASQAGKQLETMLETTKLFQQQMKVYMEQYLQQINLATRGQVSSIAERLTHIEMRLDDLEAKLDTSLDQLGHMRAALETESPRDED
jgi:hypothetical protein